MRFYQSHKQTGQGDAATVQNMRQFIAALLCLETRFHPARLKVLGIGNTANFQIAPLPRSPNLDVLGLGCGKAHVAATEREYAVVKPQLLQRGLGVNEHFLKLIITVFRLHHLD